MISAEYHGNSLEKCMLMCLNSLDICIAFDAIAEDGDHKGHYECNIYGPKDEA